MLLIKENREKENKTEAQYILEGTAENLRYYRERIDALQKLEAKTPANKKKLLDEIHSIRKKNLTTVTEAYVEAAGVNEATGAIIYYGEKQKKKRTLKDSGKKDETKKNQ